MIIPVNVSSERLTVRFTNRFGDHSGSLDHAVISHCSADGTPAGDYKDLTVGGNPAIHIPAGKEIVTDPVEMRVNPGEYLAVTVYCVEKPQTVSSVGYFIQEAKKRGEDHCTENFEVLLPNPRIEKMIHQPKLFSMPYFKSITVETKDMPKGILVFGDSITAQGRWWKPVQEALYCAHPHQIVMSNYGICGNQLTADAPNRMPMFGVRGLERIQWDGYTDDGITDILFALGINDIGMGAGNVETFIEGCKSFVNEAHNHNLNVYALSIYPAVPDRKRAEEVERTRIACIAAEKEIFDGYLDLDPVLKKADGIGYIDGISYDDGTHLLESGGRKVADALIPFLEKRLGL